MKKFAKFGIFGLLLIGFGIISPRVHAVSYTVDFVTNGGGTVTSQTVEEGDTLDVSAISVHKDGYSFSGWYTESGFVNEFNIDTDPVMSDLTLYAKWREHKIRVIYHANGGVNGSNGNPVSDPLPYAGSLGVQYLSYNGTNWGGINAAPDYLGNSSTRWLAKRGYKGHTGWLVGSPDSDLIISTTEPFSRNRKVAEAIRRLDEFKAGDIEIDLYAWWTLAEYNLTYSGLDDCIFVDGENPTSYTMLSGDITLNNPSKTGYTFMGRSGTDIEGLSTGVVITGDSIGNRIFEAVWQINSYTITYDIDGKNKNIVTGDYNSDVVKPQDPRRNGYKFIGWDKEIPETMPAENIVITAKWEKLGYSGGGGRGSTTKDSDDNGKDKTDNDDKKTETSIDSKPDDTGNNQNKDSESKSDETSDGTDGKIDLDDLMDVYLWARDNGITTGEMAKLVVDFVENVLGREIPTKIPSQCNRGDEGERESDEIGVYAKKSCALGLMGIYMKNFKPNKLLDRAEFGTIISRVLWGEKYNIPNATKDNKYYVKHLDEVKKENLITKIENPEAIKELRKWIRTVLQKIKK